MPAPEVLTVKSGYLQPQPEHAFLRRGKQKPPVRFDYAKVIAVLFCRDFFVLLVIERCGRVCGNRQLQDQVLAPRDILLIECTSI